MAPARVTPDSKPQITCQTPYRRPRVAAGGCAREAALLTAFAGRIYDHAPQQNAVPLDG
jgi:hypothetical protein